MPDITIHFLRPPDWAEPIRVHYWDRSSATGVDTDRQSRWPGVRMTQAHDRPGWYQVRFADTTRVHLVFNDGDGRQSPDLARTRDGWFSFDRHWQDAPPSPSAASDPPAGAAAQEEAAGSLAADCPAEAPRTPASATLDPRPIEAHGDFREETIFFLLTTRFYDGDPSNNFFCRDRIRFDAHGIEYGQSGDIACCTTSLPRSFQGIARLGT